MAGYRDKNKTHVGAWIKTDVKDFYAAKAAREGRTLSDVLVEALENAVAKRAKEKRLSPVKKPAVRPKTR